MKTAPRRDRARAFPAFLLLVTTLSSHAATVRYVNVDNPTPVSPYTNWAEAATNIQDAVDAAEAGDEIEVTNGVYQTGARAVSGMSNRVAVTKPVVVRSVNGPAVTQIKGYQVPGTTTGPAAVRCVYLTNGAVLVGFTLTNGATQTFINWRTNGSGGGVWCEGPAAVLSNCVLVGNSAYGFGGGARNGTLNNCMLTSNSAEYGGGAYSGRLMNCLLTGNSAGDEGGGANSATLFNCTLTGNSAWRGGGAFGGTLNNCLVYYNTASWIGGANYEESTFNYCCTTPLPPGPGNLIDPPQLASASHLSAGSPCIGRGSADFASGVDIDGEPWANPPSIGCDEYRTGSVTGALGVAIMAANTMVKVGVELDFQAVIGGRAGASRWDFGDGTVVSNLPYATHAWAAEGDYVVELRVFNESHPAGAAATVAVRVGPPVHYVALHNRNPVPPYTSWATAATNIQEAVDAAAPGGRILVTNGVYKTGARMMSGTSNRVVVAKPVEVRSVHGPAVTQIVGYKVPGTNNGPSAVRCVYLANGAVLAGFTLTNGATPSFGEGGGVSCESASAVVSNCVLTGNSAFYGGGASSGMLNNCTLSRNSATYGGAAYLSTLRECTLTDNSAGSGGGAHAGDLNNCVLTRNTASSGGAAYGGMLNNCTLTGNMADEGGGAFQGALNNCIAYFNNARRTGANFYEGTLNYCCTTPLPATGTGNLDIDPRLASASHLSAGSPCIGRGSEAFASGVDIDGEPWASPPSIGCDEYWSGSVTGAISVAVVAAYTNVAVGFPVDFQAVIGGRISASRWNFGDGVVVSNRLWASHAWAAAGTYVVELRAYNESHPTGVVASINVRVQTRPIHYVTPNSFIPIPPYSSWITGARSIQDAVNAATLPGALVLVTNGLYQTGARTVWGMSNRLAVTKPVTVRSVNGPSVTRIKGYQVPGMTNGPTALRCVYLTNGAVLAGFTLTNGATQTSGDSFRNQSGGGVWCEGPGVVVSNCVLTGNSASYYGGGAHSGTLVNCTVKSNSASYAGGGVGNAALSNCALTGNSAEYGGGSYGGSLNNCTLTGNSATSLGGGAFAGMLRNCALTGNSAWEGGGAFVGSLNNCTLTGNSADYGGGVYNGTLNNCIVYYNGARFSGANYEQDDGDGSLSFCCTIPMPAGPDNLTNAPSFVSTNGWSDLRLQSNSPCINAGNNDYASGSTNLDGNPRIVSGTVDIGAYEFQTPASQLSYAWLQHYGLPTDGSADFADSDGDRANNWQEWKSATVPTDALFALRLLTPQIDGMNLAVSWESVSGLRYRLEGSTGLGTNASFLPLATNLTGKAGTTTFIHTNGASAGVCLYRVGVE